MPRTYWCEEGKHEFVVPDDYPLLVYCPLHPKCLGVLIGETEEASEEEIKAEIETGFE